VRVVFEAEQVAADVGRVALDLGARGDGALHVVRAVRAEQGLLVEVEAGGADERR
jgi:hypothetical protein